MTITLHRRLAMTLILAAALSPAGMALVRADSPGGLFMDLDEGAAVVARPATTEAKARIMKPATLPSDEVAAAIREGAQPVGTHVILAYRGQLYIVPDKQVGDKMVSELVMHNKD